jgi:hypothetical protein
LTSSKSNNSNNNKDNNQNNINKAVNLFPRWEIEQKEWNTEAGTKDIKVHNLDSNKSKTIQVLGFPRLKPPIQLHWEKFYSSIVEPISGMFYPERDLQGNIIEPSDGGPRARTIISQIIRLKSVTGEEYLYSIGTIYGFNSMGVLVSYPYYKKEVYTKTLFKKNRFFDSKTGHMTERVENPISQQDQYLLKSSPSAVDEMFAQTLKPDTPLVYRRDKHKTPTNPCTFIVKEEASSRAVQVAWSDVQTTLSLFKHKPFYYLFRSEYIPQSVKDTMREMNEGITGEKTPTNPTAASSNNFTPNNSSSYNAYK